MKNKRALLTIIIGLSLILQNAAAIGSSILPIDEDHDIPYGSSTDGLIALNEAKTNLIETQQAVESSLSGFVTRDGSDLLLDGQEFRFSHANQYYLFYKSQFMVDDVFADAASLGLNVFRTWGFCDGMYKEGVSFQPSPGVYDESGFLHMDYVISKAAEYGLKLIIPMVNNWDDFGGINQYVEWYLGRTPSYYEHDLFFTEPTIKNWYKDYVSYFVNRINSYTGIAYKDDPTILMWELANEPRAYSDYSGTILQPWINEMAEFIKTQVDSNHLLSTGTEGWYGYMQGVDFIQAHSSPYIDASTFHLFPDFWGLSDEDSLNWITQRITDSHTILNKPVYIGEFGKMVDRTLNKREVNVQMSARNELYDNIYKVTDVAGGNGLGFWLLSGRQDDGTLYPDYDRFTVYTPEDRKTTDIIKNGSSLFTGIPPTKGNGKGKGGPKKSSLELYSEYLRIKGKKDSSGLAEFLVY